MLGYTITSVSTKTFAKTQNMDWYQRGEKNVGNSYIYTHFRGTISATKGSAFLWWGDDDSVTWKGTSSTGWLGTIPSFNADSISHTDIIWIDGSGKPSYSVGISAGTSGVDGTIGVSSNFDGVKSQYSYSISNEWRVNIDYSYSGNIWSASYVGQKSIGTVLLGNTFYVVDSEVDQTKDNRSECWFS